MKTCKACSQMFPESGFGFKDRKAGRRDTTCRPCRQSSDKERLRIYRQANGEKLRERHRAWSAENADRIRAYRAAEDPEHVRARHKRFYEANIESEREKRRLYYAENREARLAYGRAHLAASRPARTEASARRRARLAAAPVIEKIDRSAIIARDSSRCHICGRACRLSEITLDHLIPVSRGGEHTARNLAVAHDVCNKRRGAGRIPAQLLLIG